MARSLKKRVEEALSERLFSQGAPRWQGRPSYALRPEDVLVPRVDLDVVRKDLERADGNELQPRKKKSGEELPPKFHAAHSSAALMVNTLGPFRQSAGQARVGGRGGFTELEFEHQLETGTGGPAANLDAFLASHELSLGVESKLSELLSEKKARFSSKYDSIVKREADQSWRDLYRELKKDPALYKRVDAAQLVKHYLGLCQAKPRRKTELIYLFWEPLNATAFDEYREHAAEAEALASRLANSQLPLQVLRYSELWQELEAVDPEHVANLRSRYEVVI